MTASDTPFSRLQRRLARGDLIAASHEIADWMKRQPADAGALTAHAIVLRVLGRYPEAAAALECAVAIAPEFAPTLVELARLARRDGRFEQALAWYEQAHRHAPDETGWFEEWCELLTRLGRADYAAEVASGWCEREPASPQAWFLLALISQQRGALTAALDAYQRVRALDPDYPMLSNNLSALHISLGDHKAALRFCEDAIRREPNSALPWINAATAWLRRRQPENALLAAQRACTLSPGSGSALLALSNTLKELQRHDEALQVVTRAAQMAPNDAKVQWSIAMLQLLFGDYPHGWLNHEARWAGSPELERASQPGDDRKWRGENLAGKTLLVWGEQGFGDAIQYVRFVQQIAARVRSEGGDLTYCCFAPLLALFERMLTPYGVRVLPEDMQPWPRFDFHLSVGSLPLALGCTLDTLPAPRRYLEPDPAKLATWRNRLSRDRRLKVGLVWSGSRTHQRNPLRSVPPASYAQTFADLPEVAFYSLQIDGVAEVREMASAGLSLTDYTGELHSFDDTAALIGNLDVVITVCTSLAHLCGALGVRTWLLLDINPHWAWMLARRDSAWYPSLTLYRQQQYEDWSPVLAQVRADLLGLLP
ncbi:tetratricopeptide repeat protein [Paraburkholderia antibiotica]|uniref:Tetratricopeptide repeat protein n=1 Tax=Paraburkholderia antibiotica TaxID=2728839 RepID=A0A7X9ZWB6_9BURK|nr:tetratricopeptide repeat protein [Paraburkholderia antibiotica]NML31014.1 tetratricopeptide repeat protein [Paraburkholderia antibiotica]